MFRPHCIDVFTVLRLDLKSSLLVHFAAWLLFMHLFAADVIVWSVFVCVESCAKKDWTDWDAVWGLSQERVLDVVVILHGNGQLWWLSSSVKCIWSFWCRRDHSIFNSIATATADCNAPNWPMSRYIVPCEKSATCGPGAIFPYPSHFPTFYSRLLASLTFSFSYSFYFFSFFSIPSHSIRVVPLCFQAGCRRRLLNQAFIFVCVDFVLCILFS